VGRKCKTARNIPGIPAAPGGWGDALRIYCQARNVLPGGRGVGESTNIKKQSSYSHVTTWDDAPRESIH